MIRIASASTPYPYLQSVRVYTILIRRLVLSPVNKIKSHTAECGDAVCRHSSPSCVSKPIYWIMRCNRLPIRTVPVMGSYNQMFLWNWRDNKNDLIFVATNNRLIHIKSEPFHFTSHAGRSTHVMSSQFIEFHWYSNAINGNQLNGDDDDDMGITYFYMFKWIL